MFTNMYSSLGSYQRPKLHRVLLETGCKLLTGDFDADKRSDLVCRKNGGMGYQIALSGLDLCLYSIGPKIMAPMLCSQYNDILSI